MLVKADRIAELQYDVFVRQGADEIAHQKLLVDVEVAQNSAEHLLHAKTGHAVHDHFGTGGQGVGCVVHDAPGCSLWRALRPCGAGQQLERHQTMFPVEDGLASDVDFVHSDSKWLATGVGAAVGA